MYHGPDHRSHSGIGKATALSLADRGALAVVLILLALQQAAITACASARVPVWLLVPVLPSLAESVVVLAWLAVVLLGLTGRQRKAAAIASIWLTLALLILVILVTAIMQQGHNVNVPMTLFQFAGMADVPVVLVSLAACSLVFSPGPRRGLAIVGWRRACLMTAGLSAGLGFPSIVQLADPAAPGEILPSGCWTSWRSRSRSPSRAYAAPWAGGSRG